MQATKSKLTNLKINNDAFQRFEPNELLNDIYDLNSDLEGIKIGELPYEYVDEEIHYDDNSSEEFDELY